MRKRAFGISVGLLLVLGACGRSPGSMTGSVNGKALNVRGSFAESRFSSSLAIKVTDIDLFNVGVDACPQNNTVPGADTFGLDLAVYQNVDGAHPDLPLGAPNVGTYNVAPNRSIPTRGDFARVTFAGDWNSCGFGGLFEASGVSGTVVVKSNGVGGDGFLTGTFDVTFDTGDHVTGTFDAPPCPWPCG